MVVQRLTDWVEHAAGENEVKLDVKHNRADNLDILGETLQQFR